MRNATKQLAASVLRQCSGTVSILLQYNPDSESTFTSAQGQVTVTEIQLTALCIFCGV